eukprot:g76015.t1
MYVSFWPSQAAGLLAGSLLALLCRGPQAGWRGAILLVLTGSAWVRTLALDEDPTHSECRGVPWALEPRWTWALDCLGWACLTVGSSGGAAVGWLLAGTGVLCVPLLAPPPAATPALLGTLTALLAGLLYSQRLAHCRPWLVGGLGLVVVCLLYCWAGPGSLGPGIGVPAGVVPGRPSSRGPARREAPAARLCRGSRRGPGAGGRRGGRGGLQGRHHAGGGVGAAFGRASPVDLLRTRVPAPGHQFGRGEEGAPPPPRAPASRRTGKPESGPASLNVCSPGAVPNYATSLWGRDDAPTPPDQHVLGWLTGLTIDDALRDSEGRLQGKVTLPGRTVAALHWLYTNVEKGFLRQLQILPQPPRESTPLRALLHMLNCKEEQHYDAVCTAAQCRVQGKPAWWIRAGSNNLVTSFADGYVLRVGYRFVTQKKLDDSRAWATLLKNEGIGVRYLLYDTPSGGGFAGLKTSPAVQFTQIEPGLLQTPELDDEEDGARWRHSVLDNVRHKPNEHFCLVRQIMQEGQDVERWLTQPQRPQDLR